MQQRRLCSIGLKSKHFYESVSDAQSPCPARRGLARPGRANNGMVFCGKMREAHFPTKHHTSDKRRRHEQGILMEIRQAMSASSGNAAGRARYPVKPQLAPGCHYSSLEPAEQTYVRFCSGMQAG